MATHALKYNHLIEVIYNLPFEDRIELKNQLEHNIADSK